MAHSWKFVSTLKAMLVLVVVLAHGCWGFPLLPADHGIGRARGMHCRFSHTIRFHPSSCLKLRGSGEAEGAASEVVGARHAGLPMSLPVDNPTLNAGEPQSCQKNITPPNLSDVRDLALNSALPFLSWKSSWPFLSWKHIFFGEVVVLAFSVFAGVAGVMLAQVVAQWRGKTGGALAVYGFLPFLSIPICAVGGSVAWIILQYRGLAFFYAGYVTFCIVAWS